MSELALQRIAENKKNKDPYLDLGRCGLRKVPEEIGDCTWLETLILSNEWWSWEKRARIQSQNKGKKTISVASRPPYPACCN